MSRWKTIIDFNVTCETINSCSGCLLHKEWHKEWTDGMQRGRRIPMSQGQDALAYSCDNTADHKVS